MWSKAEQALHINVLKLKATIFLSRLFADTKGMVAVHVQMNNQAALVYLSKTSETKDLLMIQEEKKYGNFVWPIGSHFLQNIYWGL